MVSSSSTRPLANFHPNVWGDHFLHFTPLPNEAGDKREVEELKEVVKGELKEASSDLIPQLKLIDAIQRLGVEYHFEEEIEEALHTLSQNFRRYCNENHDIYPTALGFRLLRQHGYKVSCEIFKNFEEAGEWRVEEAEGLLEFFEASYLRVRGEKVLEHAFAYTRSELKKLLPSLIDTNILLAQEINSALHGHSKRRGLTRLNARKYIAVYEQYPSHHRGLLRLAKLDFNLVQSMHMKELSELYSWSFSSLDQLPDYMKIFYKGLLELGEEIQEEMEKQGKSYRADYAIEAIKVMVRDYMVEVKWREEKYKPKSEGYMRVGTATCAYTSLIIISFIGMGDLATKEAFEWVLSQPDMVKSTLLISRLSNDIAGHEFEKERDHIPSIVECYMEEHNVTKESAVSEFKKQIEEGWKDINEAFLKPTEIPAPLLYRILNFARVIENIYFKDQDWYTHVGPEMQTFIRLLFIDHIAL